MSNQIIQVSKDKLVIATRLSIWEINLTDNKVENKVKSAKNLKFENLVKGEENKLLISRENEEDQNVREIWEYDLTNAEFTKKFDISASRLLNINGKLYANVNTENSAEIQEIDLSNGSLINTIKLNFDSETDAIMSGTLISDSNNNIYFGTKESKIFALQN